MGHAVPVLSQGNMLASPEKSPCLLDAMLLQARQSPTTAGRGPANLRLLTQGHRGWPTALNAGRIDPGSGASKQSPLEWTTGPTPPPAWLTSTASKVTEFVALDATRRGPGGNGAPVRRLARGPRSQQLLTSVGLPAEARGLRTQGHKICTPSGFGRSKATEIVRPRAHPSAPIQRFGAI